MYHHLNGQVERPVPGMCISVPRFWDKVDQRCHTQIGDLMKDWRRLNVSFTRARSKLIVIGSRRTLQADDVLKKFFGIMDEKKWILTLERGAHCTHGPLSSKKPNRPFKRAAGDRSSTHSPETSPRGPLRPNKRSRTANFGDQSALLRSRHLLRDVVNDSK